MMMGAVYYNDDFWLVGRVSRVGDGRGVHLVRCPVHTGRDQAQAGRRWRHGGNHPPQMGRPAETQRAPGFAAKVQRVRSCEASLIPSSTTRFLSVYSCNPSHTMNETKRPNPVTDELAGKLLGARLTWRLFRDSSRRDLEKYLESLLNDESSERCLLVCHRRSHRR